MVTVARGVPVAGRPDQTLTIPSRTTWGFVGLRETDWAGGSPR
jgi:hypothetical protein